MTTLVNIGVINVNMRGLQLWRDKINSNDRSVYKYINNKFNNLDRFCEVIPDKLEVVPDFAVGTAADRYIFKNTFNEATKKQVFIMRTEI